MKKNFNLITLCVLFPFLLIAQDWSWVKGIGAPWGSQLLDMTHTQDGGWAIVGNVWYDFEHEEWSTENTLTGFLMVYNPDNTFKWAIDCGPSVDISLLTRVTSLENGDLLCGGRFTDVVHIGDTVLIADGEANFIARYSLNGEFKWAHTFSARRIEDIAALPGNKLAVSGYFRHQFTMEDSTFTFPDQGVNHPQHAFVAVFDSLGQVEWMTHQSGDEGFSEITGVTALPDNSMIIGGSAWGGNVSLAGQLIITNEGRNIFLAKIDTDGQLLWIKQASGGILTDIEQDHEGYFYATGYAGQSLIISDDIVLELDTYHSIGFIVKYDIDGNPLYAKFSGETGSLYPKKIAVNSNLVGIAGTYRNQIHFDDLISPYSGNNSTFYGFTAGFRADDGQAQWVVDIPSYYGPEQEYIDLVANSISINEEDQVLVGGIILDDGLFNGEYITPGGNFVAELSPTLTDIPANLVDEWSFKSYPNPTRDILYIELPKLKNKSEVQLKLFSSLGSLVQELTIDNLNTENIELDLTDLNTGLYYWSATQSGALIGSGSVVKK